MSEKINGVIVKVRYYNNDNGYTIGLFELDYQDHSIATKKSKLFGNTITIVGNFERKPVEEEEYILNGNFVKNKNYGLQFAIESYERKEIANIEGIINYLSSDLFPGVGVKAAKTVVETLGVEALKIIQDDPEALNKVKISEIQKASIKEGISHDVVNQEIMLFFLEYGLTLDTIHKIIKIFGDKSIDVVKENPYILMEHLERFGFKKNDAFALKLGIAKNDLRRLKAVTCYILKELIYSSGNSYIEKSTLYEKMTAYLEEEIASEDYNRILNYLVTEKKIYLDYAKEYPHTVNVFDYALYMQELELADEIVKLLTGKRNPDQEQRTYNKEEINKYFEEVKKESSISYSPEQEMAIRLAFSEPLVIVTGGPGTGKTTIIHSIIKLYLKLNRDSQTLAQEIALLAPTGRAAKRLKETTMMDAKTIHKFLGYVGSNIFTYNKYNRTSARLIIVDEASMMDLTLAHRLLTSMHEDARLIVVGDVDQLPSVGPGQILKDLIQTKEIKTIRLNKIHRQAEGSSIIRLAHSINEGILPPNLLETMSDRKFIPTENEYITPLILDIVKKAIDKGKSIIKDIQILIPMYRGDMGINEVNNRIQELVNPISAENKIGGEVKHLGRSFRINDKVIQLVNRVDKNIMNGDIGVVLNITYKDLKPQGLTVLFDVGPVEYTYEELEDLSLAYAISVHKAQGSEFDIVIMPISNLHYIMLKRKLIYTAVTRAKKSLIMLGDVKALQMAVSRIEINRNTILKDKVIEYLHHGMNDLICDDPALLIEDEESAFSTIGEKDFGKLKISDFEDI